MQYVAKFGHTYFYFIFIYQIFLQLEQERYGAVSDSLPYPVSCTSTLSSVNAPVPCSSLGLDHSPCTQEVCVWENIVHDSNRGNKNNMPLFFCINGELVGLYTVLSTPIR